ncbi:MAG: PspA-associated protein PspAA [Solirubrobacteraceae bacterium]
MIVRIATEGQYRLNDDQLPRLRELDAELISAAESGDPERFGARFAELLQFVRSGELLDEAHLGPSDAILPPPDVSLAEATRELRTEDLIPS